MKWISVGTELPPVSPQDYTPITSGPLLVHRKFGSMCVARYEAWDNDEPEFHWVTDCSEGWRIDAEVTHWMKLPESPEDI